MHNLTITQPSVVWTRDTADTSMSADRLRLVRIMRQEERGVKAEDAMLMLLICTSLDLISGRMYECTDIGRKVSTISYHFCECRTDEYGKDALCRV